MKYMTNMQEADSLTSECARAVQEIRRQYNEARRNLGLPPKEKF